MEDKLKALLDEWWAPRAGELREKLSGTVRELEEFLEREGDNGNGESAKLRAPSGASVRGRIDMSKLASLLGPTHHKQFPDAGRVARMREDLKFLREIDGGSFDPRPGFARLANDAGEIIAGFNEHMRHHAATFRALRRAEIDLRAKYDPKTHPAFFEKFDWRELDTGEMRLCPPFAVFAEAPEVWGSFLGALADLLVRGRPIKVFVLSSGFPTKTYDYGRATALRLYPDFAFFALSLRGVYVARRIDPFADDTAVLNGMDSPRSALFSIWDSSKRADDDGRRARYALASRAFSNFVFDPDLGFDTTECLDIDDNPNPDRDWADVDQAAAVTFADFAAGEDYLKEHFTRIAAADIGTNHVPLLDFLKLTTAERMDTTPYITDSEGQALLPSRAIIDRTIERARQWRTLQTLAGLTESAQAAPAEPAAPAAPATIPANFEGEVLQRAVHNIVAGLLGVAPPHPTTGAGTPAASTTVAAPAAEPPAPAPNGDATLPWIESELCTACDECVNINRQLFVYNRNKQAEIRDPRGGPYRDIVRAAERCTAGIIHPGRPLDPNEKDLEKWVARGEKFD